MLFTICICNWQSSCSKRLRVSSILFEKLMDALQTFNIAVWDIVWPGRIEFQSIWSASRQFWTAFKKWESACRNVTKWCCRSCCSALVRTRGSNWSKMQNSSLRTQAEDMGTIKRWGHTARFRSTFLLNASPVLLHALVCCFQVWPDACASRCSRLPFALAHLFCACRLVAVPARSSPRSANSQFSDLGQRAKLVSGRSRHCLCILTPSQPSVMYGMGWQWSKCVLWSELHVCDLAFRNVP